MLTFVVCIEIHPWLSRWPSPERPTAAVLDLDPAPPAGFAEARVLALRLGRLLAHLGLECYPKTSGASGLHLYLPLSPRYTFAEVRRALNALARACQRAWPELVTLERPVRLRSGRVYLDVGQNARGKTIASVYSVRPLPGAPVSFPLTWKKLEDERLDPLRFNLDSVPELLARRGDLLAPVLGEGENLDWLLSPGLI